MRKKVNFQIKLIDKKRSERESNLSVVCLSYTSLLVQTVSSEFSGVQLITINCSAQLTAESVLHSLQQVLLHFTDSKANIRIANHFFCLLLFRIA